MVNIVKVNASEIKMYSEDQNLVNREHIPISRHRALSYSANPRASSTDVVLYLAFKDDLMVAYRTILPDTLFIGDRQVKVGWLSGNWVHPDYRRKGISLTLLKEVLIDWDNKLLYTNFAPESKAVYDKSDEFELLYRVKGIRLYLRSSLSKLLPVKNRFYRSIRLPLIIIDKILNFLNPIPLLNFIFAGNNDITFEYCSRPDDEISELFESVCKHTPTQRSRFELQWIVRFPWLVSSPLGDRIGAKYFFSSSPDKFCQLMVKVYKNDNLIGFIILNQHGDRLSIPYIYYSPKHLRSMARVVLHHAVKLRASTLTVYNLGLTNAIKRVKPFSWLSKNQYRSYFATKTLMDVLKDQHISFNDGDGDCAFL